MHSRQLTFIQVMEDTRYQALNSYLIKALKSNHLAKVTQGVDRRRAYEIKHHYLSEAISMAPSDFTVDSLFPKSGLIGLEGPAGFRFHAPIVELSGLAKQTLSSKIVLLFD